MGYYVYILLCSDNTYYTGWTKNLEKRVYEHNHHNASKYTRSRRPVYLKYAEEHISQSSAMKRECAIKKLNRVDKERLWLR